MLVFLTALCNSVPSSQQTVESTCKRKERLLVDNEIPYCDTTICLLLQSFKKNFVSFSRKQNIYKINNYTILTSDKLVELSPELFDFLHQGKRKI